MPKSEATAIRVLVIDDQKTMRSIIHQLLDQVGIHDVVEAENGKHALDLLHKAGFEEPDVIICDLHMEKIDGMELCNHIRRGRDPLVSKEIPFLILTGDRDSFVHDVTRQVGATRILTKPISAPDLLKEIQAAIGFADVS